MKRSLLRTCSALVAAGMILQPVLAARALAQGAAVGTPSPVVILAPGATPDIQAYVNDPAADPQLSDRELINLLRHRVKYVFVLFQENRSFDHYFGTYRGANGLFSNGGSNPVPRPPAQTPGFTQQCLNLDGSPAAITPFRIGSNQHAADLDDVDHSHARPRGAQRQRAARRRPERGGEPGRYPARHRRRRPVQQAHDPLGLV